MLLQHAALLDALLSACTHIKTARHCIAQINKYRITKGVGEQGVEGVCLRALSSTFSRSSLHLRDPALVRASILASATASLLLIRIYFIGGGTPTFIDSDNPASFSPYFQTRLLTYSYLCAVNVWLLLCPSSLCHDWSMGSVPLVNSINDWRNIATILLAISATLLAWRGSWYATVMWARWMKCLIKRVMGCWIWLQFFGFCYYDYAFLTLFCSVYKL